MKNLMSCILIFVEIIIYIGMASIRFKILLGRKNSGRGLYSMKCIGLLKFDWFFILGFFYGLVDGWNICIQNI